MLFIEAFKMQVNKSPMKNAVECEQEFMTYKELDNKSSQLASLLIEKGVSRNKVVAVYQSRGINMLISIIAIMKAGGCYLPVDSEAPSERINYMLKNSETCLILADRDYDANLNRQIPLVNIAKLDIVNSNKDYNIIKNYPDDLAYVLYTSGTTGQPKGVMIEQKGMMNHLEAKIEDLHIDDFSIVAQTASQCFDISVWQFIAPLIVGGKVIIYPDSTILNLNVFLQSIVEDKITILELVPSYLISLLDKMRLKEMAKLDNIKYVISTGEKLTVSLAKKILESLPGVNVVNAYGPTEASDDITHYIFNKIEIIDNIPIGKPIKNMKIYIVNENGDICKPHERGEIWVAGIGVGRGYINNKLLTDKAFILNPFETNGERLYKTGDIGSLEEDNNIMFWGRKDNQIKYNGQRIELDEIEIVLSNHNALRQVCVIFEETDNNQKICAYYCTYDNSEINDLLNFCNQYLPKHMIPTEFILCDNLPLTSNGKIDRTKLRNIAVTKKQESVINSNPVITKLIKLVTKYVNSDKYSSENIFKEDFQKLGIDSLSFIRLIIDVEAEFDIEVDTELLILEKGSNLEGLAEYVLTKVQ